MMKYAHPELLAVQAAGKTIAGGSGRKNSTHCIDSTSGGQLSSVGAYEIDE